MNKKKTEEVMKKVIKGLPLTKEEEVIYEAEVAKISKLIESTDRLLTELKEEVKKK